MPEFGFHVHVEAMVDEHQFGFAGWEASDEDVSWAV